jgi:hypothetical protein
MGAFYTDTLESMVGHVVRARPNADRSLAVDWLNFRVRQLLDRRPYWAGLLKKKVINLPAAYATGGITLTIGSNIGIGTGTNWPVSDVVNTTIPSGISRPGDIWFTPASLSGISTDSFLYIDASGTPEVVAVQQIQGTQVLARFQSSHNANCTVTQSSLTGLQLLVSTNNPYYTILAVTSSTGLILDNNWAYTPITNGGYQIVMAYTTIAPDVKELLSVVDPIQPLVIRTHVPQRWLNAQDPIRQNANSPIWLADLGPNYASNQQWEIYPPSLVPWQLYVLYYAQWPDMRLPGDRPPPFINPTVIIHGALADAFRMKMPRPPKFDDPWFNPKAADDYEKKFEMGVQDLINADNSKAQTDFTWDFDAWGISGASYAQDHAMTQNGEWLVP